MGRKLYVGNLPYSATEQSLRDAFAASGTVDSVSLITDRDTGQSKGFGFVEMATDAEAQAATQAMNGAMLDGRQIKVNEAKPRESRGGGGGGGGGRGGYGGGGGGGGYGWWWRRRRSRALLSLATKLFSRGRDPGNLRGGSRCRDECCDPGFVSPHQDAARLCPNKTSSPKPSASASSRSSTSARPRTRSARRKRPKTPSTSSRRLLVLFSPWRCRSRSISGPAPRGRRGAEGAADARRDGAALEKHQDRQAEDSLVATSVLPLRCLRR